MEQLEEYVIPSNIENGRTKMYRSIEDSRSSSDEYVKCLAALIHMEDFEQMDKSLALKNVKIERFIDNRFRIQNSVSCLYYVFCILFIKITILFIKLISFRV